MKLCVIVAVALVASGVGVSAADEVLWQTSADLDGDGRAETIALTTADAATSGGDTAYGGQADTIPIPRCRSGAPECTVRLEIGTAAYPLRIEPGYFGAVRVQVIDIDRRRRRRALLVRTNGGSGEDPPFDAALVFYRRGAVVLRSLQEPRREWADIDDVSSNGRGEITVQYRHCPDRTTIRYRVRGDVLRPVARRTVTFTTADRCSACPHVYVIEDGRPRYRGEILRDLDRPSRRARQPLALGAATRLAGAGVIELELREEEHELTYLDDIYLDVGGVPIAPLGCSDAAAWCVDDGRYHLLREGERLRLRFAIDGATGAAARLVASGFYVRLPTR